MIKQQIKEYVAGLKKIDHTFITDLDYLRLLRLDELPELIDIKNPKGLASNVVAIDYGMVRIYSADIRNFEEIDFDELSLEEVLDVGEAYEKLVMSGYFNKIGG